MPIVFGQQASFEFLSKIAEQSFRSIMGYAGVEPARDAIPRGLKPRVSTSSTNSPNY